MEKMKKIAVLIPCYNEELTIEKVIKDFKKELPQADIYVYNNNSKDKTTLLNIIGGLDRYTSGDLIINGKSTKDFKDRDWDAYRNYSVGFVFQSYNLISHQSVLSNVELALTIAGISKKERRERAIKALEEVGLKDQIHKKPNQLSGGKEDEGSDSILDYSLKIETGMHIEIIQ